MSIKPSPSLMQELKHFGLKDAGQCFHCGNCTAVCPMSTNENPFPRRFMRYAQLGMEDKLVASPEPWLCYYCGECSDRCPRGADPGETMMVMRRFLTSRYDWTGFARLFYTSEVFEVVAVSIMAALVGLAFLLFHGEVITDKVALNTFAPNWVIEIGDLIMAAILTFFLLSNVWRCVKITLGDQRSVIPAKYYIRRLFDLILNVAFQKNFGKCDDRKQWFVHLLIMSGYGSVFLMVVVLLRWFQRDYVIDPSYPWFSYLLCAVGYYATFAILYGTTYALIGRIRKSKAVYKNSHGTDWMFLILLQLTTLTGILVHVGIFVGAPMFVYVIYVIHMMVAVPMLTLEVPFAKWAHLAYRPVVRFLVDVKALYAADHPAPAAAPAAPAEPEAPAQEAEAQPA